MARCTGTLASTTVYSPNVTFGDPLSPEIKLPRLTMETTSNVRPGYCRGFPKATTTRQQKCHVWVVGQELGGNTTFILPEYLPSYYRTTMAVTIDQEAMGSVMGYVATQNGDSCYFRFLFASICPRKNQRGNTREIQDPGGVIPPTTTATLVSTTSPSGLAAEPDL